jgi:hypothetical protein
MISQSRNRNCSTERALRLPQQIQRLLSEDLEVALVGCLGHPVAEPLSDANELLEFYQSHPDHQWSLKLGEVVALEYAPQIGRCALAHLCNHDWDVWPGTLQYRWGNSLYLLFSAEAIQTRELGKRFPGVRLHNRGLLPIPPSCFGNGPQLHFVRLVAPIVRLPKWLRSNERGVEYTNAA